MYNKIPLERRANIKSRTVKSISFRFRKTAHGFRPAALWHAGNPLLCSIGLSFALVLLPGSAFSQSSSGTLLTTVYNPTPTNSDIFGGAVAPFGTDRVLVGAEGAAEAYLYSLDGTLLTTFSIPDPGGRLVRRRARGGGERQGAHQRLWLRGRSVASRPGVSLRYQRRVTDHFHQSVSGIRASLWLFGGNGGERSGAHRERGRRAFSFQHQRQAADHVHQTHQGGATTSVRRWWPSEMTVC